MFSYVSILLCKHFLFDLRRSLISKNNNCSGHRANLYKQNDSEMISSKGKFCKKLFEILTSEPSVNRFKLTVAPDEEIATNNHYYIDKSNDETSVEVICFKSTYLSIFMEAHNFLKPECLHPLDNLDNQYEVYVFTIGLLLTTTENKTNLNFHEEIFLKLLLELEKTSSSSQIITFFENELRIVERLLSSSNNKLNKSSSLWYFYRKLFVLSQKIPLLSQRTDREIIIKTHIYSASEHRSNYYCWNTARWFFYLFPPYSKEIFLKATEKFCFANTNDCSAWSALGYMVSNDAIEQKFSFENYKYIAGRYSETFPGSASFIQSKFSIEVHSFLETVAQFIDKLEVKEWPPFLCILKILHSIPEESVQSTSFVKRWKNELDFFEEKNGPIDFINNHPTIPPLFSNNLMLTTSVKHYGMKKVFLKKCDITSY